MARTKPAGTAVAPKQSTAMVSWEDKLRGLAKKAVETEASVAVGQFLSIKGGTLSFGGNPFPGNKMDAIIAHSVLENAYYGVRYDPDNPAPPLCYAFGDDNDEMKPHPDVTEQQHATCKGCPMNEFKTAKNGKGKACKNIRRLAILAPSNPLTVDSIKKAELAFMKVPVTSVKSWATYVRTIEALRHRPPSVVITEISVVPDPKTQVKVNFAHKLDLKPDLGEAVLERLDQIEKDTVFAYPKAEAPDEKPAPKNARPSRKKY